MWVLAAICLSSAAGCGGSDGPRLVSAEFLDDSTPDGQASPGEVIQLRFDRPLPIDQETGAIRVRLVPAAEWSCRIEADEDPRTLRARILTGTPQLRLAGIHGRDAGATGVTVDLGDGREQTVDLQIVESFPVLVRAVWVDRSPPGGNLVVDQGDAIRLVFDRPVILREGGPERARVPQDIILSKASDRIDDGEIHSYFSPGTGDEEILIILGSRPILSISGTLASREAIERFQPDAPSGLALNGTRVLPMTKITDRRGGPGAVSLAEVDVEFEEGFPSTREHPRAEFPSPGHRIFHTLSPLVGGRALIAGGVASEGRQPLDQVLVFDPFQAFRKGSDPFAVGERLPHPLYHHTATSLPGADGRPGTADDLVLIAGGTDGVRARPELILLSLREDGSVDVRVLDATLVVPRAEHAAVALPGNRILVDGGRSFGGESSAGLVGCAEIVTLAFEGGSVRGAERFSFRSVPRMRHSLTLLTPTPGGDTYVLAYGGYGQARRRIPDSLVLGQRRTALVPTDMFYPTDEGAVLVSPYLMNLSSPDVSFTRLEHSFSFSLLRWGHVAVPVDEGEGGDGARTVVFLGGTLRHVLHGFDGGPSLWEMPLEVLPDLPQGHEAANAILFRFQPADPARSTLEVLPHPSPDPGQATERVSFSHVLVPGLGVIISGGEHPGPSGDPVCLKSSEMFLLETETLAELAVRLATGRSRHQAVLVRSGGSRSIFLLGGQSGAEESQEFSDVEEIPLP